MYRNKQAEKGTTKTAGNRLFCFVVSFDNNWEIHLRGITVLRSECLYAALLNLFSLNLWGKENEPTSGWAMWQVLRGIMKFAACEVQTALKG